MTSTFSQTEFSAFKISVPFLFYLQKSFGSEQETYFNDMLKLMRWLNSFGNINGEAGNQRRLQCLVKG